jgi:hypothetical protein
MQSAKFNNERDLLLSQSDVSERRELSEFLDMFSEFAEEATLPSKKTTDAELSDLCIKLKSPKFRNLYQRYQINKVTHDGYIHYVNFLFFNF